MRIFTLISLIVISYSTKASFPSKDSLNQFKIGFGISHSIFLESLYRSPKPKIPLNVALTVEIPLKSEASIEIRAWSFSSFIRIPDNEFDVLKRDFITAAVSYKHRVSQDQNSTFCLLMGASFRNGSEWLTYDTPFSHHNGGFITVNSPGVLLGFTNEIKLSPRLRVETDLCYNYNYIFQTIYLPVDKKVLNKSVIAFSARFVGVFGRMPAIKQN